MDVNLCNSEVLHSEVRWLVHSKRFRILCKMCTFQVVCLSTDKDIEAITEALLCVMNSKSQLRHAFIESERTRRKTSIESLRISWNVTEFTTCTPFTAIDIQISGEKCVASSIVDAHINSISDQIHIVLFRHENPFSLPSDVWFSPAWLWVKLERWKVVDGRTEQVTGLRVELQWMTEIRWDSFVLKTSYNYTQFRCFLTAYYLLLKILKVMFLRFLNASEMTAYWTI